MSKWVSFILIASLSLLIASPAAANIEGEETEEKGISFSSIWEFSKEFCGVTIIFLIAMAFFGSMAGSVPFIAKDSVTGVLSHEDYREAGIGLMVLSTLIYAALLLGLVWDNFGIEPISIIKICGISIVVLVVIGFLINRK